MIYPLMFRSKSCPDKRSISIEKNTTDRRATIGCVYEQNDTRKPIIDANYVIKSSKLIRTRSLTSFFIKNMGFKTTESTQERVFPVETPEVECFRYFQDNILQFASMSANVSYQALSKHSHVNSNCSSTRSEFSYRGATANNKLDSRHIAGNVLNFNDKKYIKDEQARIRHTALSILHIPYKHVSEIDALLEGIRRVNTPVTTTQPPQINALDAVSLVNSIDAKISIKKLLLVSLECIDCELQNLSVIQFKLLNERVSNTNECTPNTVNVNTTRTNLHDAIDGKNTVVDRRAVYDEQGRPYLPGYVGIQTELDMIHEKRCSN
jgi:hypothetical protein